MGNASNALVRELGEFFEAFGAIVIEGYGLTESSPVLAANRVDDYKFGSVGKPFPGVEIKIAPDGEILARGPNIMKGYYKNKKETDATIKDGWLYTGDIGVFDTDGFLLITDRKKHLFKTSAGKYIAPTPIENTFLGSKYIDQFVLLVTGFPYNIAENPEEAFERFTILTKKSRGMRRLGSAAIDFCYLASGVFDGFWEVHLHPWDMCAGILIAEEAGGIVTDFHGNSIDIFSKKILSTNNQIHKLMIEVMEKINY